MRTATRKPGTGQVTGRASSEDERPRTAQYRAGTARSIAGLAGCCVAAVGLAIFAGWLLDVPLLRGSFSGREMTPGTAIGFVATGGALLLTISAPNRVQRRSARLLAALAIVIGALTALAHLIGHSPDITGLLFPSTGSTNTVAPAASQAQAASEFIWLGSALLLLNTAHGAKNRLVGAIAGTSFVITLLATVGYILGTSGLAGIPGTTTVVFSTAITFLLLSAGIVAAGSTAIFGGVLTTGGPGGVVLRRLLPTSAVAFPAFGWLVLEGERHGLYSLASGLAWFVLVSTLVLALTAFSLAKRLNQLDLQGRAAAAKAERLAALVDASNEAIMSSDDHGIITSCNRACEGLYGYAEAELIGRSIAILSPTEKRAEQLQLMEAAARGDLTVERDTQRLHKNGSLLDVSLTLSGITKGGSLGGYCAVTRDIGRRVLEHDQLETAVRLRTHELSRSRAETLHSLALAAEYHDYETAEHTHRVGQNAALVATALGLPASSVELIRQAAPLHDVGKIGIPDRILLKPAALTPEELDVMKEHTILGSRLLARSDSPVLQLGTRIALAHHERWNGEGYPAGLAGEAIPIEARIVAVVDAFDAMAHDRPYRSAFTIDEAVGEILRCSGTQFDPRVVAAFRSLFAGSASPDVGNTRSRSEHNRTPGAPEHAPLDHSDDQREAADHRQATRPARARNRGLPIGPERVRVSV